jgi:hypothetical protein
VPIGLHGLVHFSDIAGSKAIIILGSRQRGH